MARAKQARQDLMQAELEAQDREEQAKLTQMRREQDEYLAKQKAQDVPQISKQPSAHNTPASIK